MVGVSESGVVRFRVFAPGAYSVALVGEFTGWLESAVAMRRDEDGHWSVVIRLPPGRHRFKYLVDGEAWLADYAADALVENPFGTLDSVVGVGGLRLTDAPAGPEQGLPIPSDGRRAA